jgi:hypothetical protein
MRYGKYHPYGPRFPISKLVFEVGWIPKRVFGLRNAWGKVLEVVGQNMMVE